jgi:DNA polymerase-3 subunit epsilon
MNWIGRLLGRRELPPHLALRLDAWRRLAEPDPAVAPQRWIVVDTETSGLNTARHKLIAIGAVAIENEAIMVDPSFEVVLRQETASTRDNIELHGVGAAAQAHGEEPAEALLRFLEFARKDTLVAFHAAFDAAFLRRAIKTHLGLRFDSEWLDVAVLAPLIFPDPAHNRRGLDAWLAHFGIDPGARHNALADAFATAQLFQIVSRRAMRDGKQRLLDLLMAAGEHAATMARERGQ